MFLSWWGRSGFDAKALYMESVVKILSILQYLTGKEVFPVLWRILAYRKIILEPRRYREMFLFGPSNDNKKLQVAVRIVRR